MVQVSVGILHKMFELYKFIDTSWILYVQRLHRGQCLVFQDGNISRIKMEFLIQIFIFGVERDVSKEL